METSYLPSTPKFEKLSKRSLTLAAAKSRTITECLRHLGISASQRTRLRIAAKLIAFRIDCSHFTTPLPEANDNAKALELYREKENEKATARQKRSRRDFLNPVKVAKWIVQDCRKMDKVRGLANDLIREAVEPLISQPCFYCGETKLRMSLDRIDISKGHLLSNVNPCCRRCNDIRGSMPYEAWMSIVPAIRAAREKGLFDGWLPGNKTRQESA